MINWNGIVVRNNPVFLFLSICVHYYNTPQNSDQRNKC